MDSRPSLTTDSSYKEICQRLAKLTTPLICDAAPDVRLMDSKIEPIGNNTQCVGRAYTVNSNQDSLSTMQALDALQAFLAFLDESKSDVVPIILTIASCGSPYALAGGMCASVAKAKGFGGVKNNIRPILIVAGLVSGGTVSMYVVLSYMPIYATKYLQLTAHDSYLSLLIAVGLMTILIPLFGWLSDRIGRKPLLLFSMTLYFIELYPCFAWLNSAPSLMKLIIIQSLFCFSLAIYYGAITAAMTEIFPMNVRSTCLSIGFNMGVMIFGAFAQLIVTLLIQFIGSPLAITIYPLFGVGICLIAASYYQKNIHSMDQDITQSDLYYSEQKVSASL